MGESFAGITVPDGTPDDLRSAASWLDGVGGQLEGAASRLRGLPGSMAGWQGPASVAYAASCRQAASAATGAGEATHTAARASRHYAEQLQAAQQAARQAVSDARDAQRRIDAATAAAAAAQADQQRASTAEQVAAAKVAFTSAHGAPSPTALAAQNQARSDGNDAANRVASARTSLQHARHDLEDAQRRGHRAEERARHAAQYAAAGWNHAGSEPVALPHHAGAHGEGGTTPWWDNDFVRQFDLTDPGKARDRATDLVAATWEKGYTKFRQRYTHVRGYWRGQGENRTWVNPYTRKLPNIPADKPFSTGPTAARWERFGRYGSRVGSAAAIGFAAWDQWQEDASDPGLTATDRVGRAAGNAAWSGGVSVAGAWAGGEVGMEAGAVIGTFICPGVGTVIGGAVGGVVGAVSGGAAGAWVANEAGAVKDGFVHTGQVVANGVADAGAGVVHGLESLGSGVGHALDDLNPF